MCQIIIMKLDAIQPSQLYINSEKLSQVMEEFTPIKMETLKPIPIKKLGNEIIYTDGHTRAFAAYLHGLSSIRVFWDEDELDWEAYEICVNWCKEAGIYTIDDLKNRLVNADEYELLWDKKCDIMHQELANKRKDTQIEIKIKDYTKERHEWLDKFDIDTIVQMIHEKRKNP